MKPTIADGQIIVKYDAQLSEEEQTTFFELRSYCIAMPRHDSGVNFLPPKLKHRKRG